MKLLSAVALVLVLLCPLPIRAQTNYAGTDALHGPTRPVVGGTVLPATCVVRDLYYKSDATPGQNLYGCTATNTWTVLSGGSGGGAGLIIRPTSSSGTAYTVTGVTGVVSMGTTAAPLVFTFVPNQVSGASPTLNINSIASLPILRESGNAIAAGELASNSIWPVACNGTNCIIQGEQLEATDSSVTVTRTANPHTVGVTPGVFVTLAGTNTGLTGAFDFGGASLTRSARTGAGSPVSRDPCTVIGQLYFQTDASAGSNLFGCTTTGIAGVAVWTLQGTVGGFANPMTVVDQFIGSAGNAGGTAAALTVPNCANDGAHALVYSTSTHTLACASVSGGGGTSHDYIVGAAGDTSFNACRFSGLAATHYGATPDFPSICTFPQGSAGTIQISYNGVAPTLRLDVMASTTDTGNITVTPKSVCVSSGTALSNTGFTSFAPSWNSGSAVNIAATGTFPVLLQGTLTFPTTGCTIGQLMFLSILRGASDTYGAHNVYIQGALPTY